MALKVFPFVAAYLIFLFPCWSLVSRRVSGRKGGRTTYSRDESLNPATRNIVRPSEGRPCKRGVKFQKGLVKKLPFSSILIAALSVGGG